MQSLDPEKVIKELKGKHWPIAIRDVAPHPDAVRLTGTTPNGLPSGVHTGGAWKLNGYVYKPVDVQPSMGCGYHIFSQEVEALLEMAGQPLFPRNWWLERRNDRTFIVRAVAWIFPEDIDYENIDRDDALMVERGVMGLNARGWEINDGIPLAMSAGPEYTLFAYDMSAAQRMTGSGAYAADERSNVIEFFDRCGQTWLAKLRRNARKVFADHILDPDMSGLPYVYSSMYRPLWIGVNVPDATYIHVMRPNLSEAIPHAWILAPQPLDDDYLRRHEFEYGWGPLTTKVAK